MSISFVILAALLVDFMLGDPRQFHPISGFGRIAGKLEKSMNTQSSSNTLSILKARLFGLFALLILIVPITLIISYLNWLFLEQSLHIIEIIILFFALGCNSLRLHATWIVTALKNTDITSARTKTSWIVSRDTRHLNPSELSKATIESILENGNDAIFATIFWFVVAGIPGVIIYRLSNTLDAMWGYKSTRFLHFGWAAARLDDLLNFVPAHLTAISYAFTGRFITAVQCWINQAHLWKSINAGIVMSTGAGALSLQLGGTARYKGIDTQRTTLGTGNLPHLNDINRAINLLQRSLALWVFVIFLLSYFNII